MERKETKRKENELTAELTTKIEKNKKEESKLIQATKTKQPKATQAERPTEKKFLSAKELAQMAGVTPTALRKTLRHDFAGKISRGDDGKQYRIKASDPIVQEIIAKVKGNEGSVTTPVKAEVETPPVSEDKGEGDEPSPESLEVDLNKGVKL